MVQRRVNDPQQYARYAIAAAQATRKAVQRKNPATAMTDRHMAMPNRAYAAVPMTYMAPKEGTTTAITATLIKYMLAKKTT
jgi:hypothetical protein